MTMSIRKMIFLCLWIVVVLLVVPPIQGQESKQDKVKLTGAQIDEFLLKPGAISFGMSRNLSRFWIIETLENGKQSVFQLSLAKPIRWATDIGTVKIDGDKICKKWTLFPEMCDDIYRVEEDKYEAWRNGTLRSTWYMVRSTYETKKDKVKLTEAELKETWSQHVV